MYLNGTPSVKVVKKYRDSGSVCPCRWSTQLGIYIMLDNSTIETLKAMHCSAMASELENQLNDSKTYGTLAF